MALPKLSQEMHQKLRDAVFALSLANLFFIRAWSAVKRGFSIPAYYRHQPNAESLAVMLNVLVLASLVWLGVQLVRRYPTPWLRWGARLVFALLALVVLNSVRMRSRWPALEISHLVKNPAFWLLLGAVAWWHKPCLRAGRALVMIFSPLILVTFGQALCTLGHRA